MSQVACRSAVLLAVALVASTCSGDRPSLNEQTTTTSTTTVSSDGPAVTAAQEKTVEFENALNGLIEAGAYRFEVDVSLSTGSSVAEIEIDGWVDGADRELILRTALGEVITRVIDGVATVERYGETVTVPLESASTEPSLEVLTKMTDVSYAPGDTILGRLSESALRDVGFEVSGSARVAAVVDDEFLIHYTITADNDAWSISTYFSDIGAVVR